jgi:quercetin dioxygenase-like cupin family protein
MQDAIVLPTEVGPGKQQEVQTLLADTWRKLVLIRLRHGAVLADHSAKVPVTIHAVLGKGYLDVAGHVYTLSPGVIVPVDAHVVHKVQAEPELAILVTFFRRPGRGEGGQGRAPSL